MIDTERQTCFTYRKRGQITEAMLRRMLRELDQEEATRTRAD